MPGHTLHQGSLTSAQAHRDEGVGADGIMWLIRHGKGQGPSRYSRETRNLACLGDTSQLTDVGSEFIFCKNTRQSSKTYSKPDAIHRCLHQTSAVDAGGITGCGSEGGQRAPVETAQQ